MESASDEVARKPQAALRRGRSAATRSATIRLNLLRDGEPASRLRKQQQRRLATLHMDVQARSDLHYVPAKLYNSAPQYKNTNMFASSSKLPRHCPKHLLPDKNLQHSESGLHDFAINLLGSRNALTALHTIVLT